MRPHVCLQEGDLAEKRYRLVMASMKKKLPETGMGTDSKIQRYCMYKDMGYRQVVEGMVTGFNAF